MDRHAALRVLVVDDNEDAANSLATLVRLWGHQAKTAFSGYGAHSLAKEFLPHVLIIDIAMPKMSGLTLAALLKEDAHLKDCRVIGLSGHTEKFVQDEAERIGFAHYLFKPAEPERLRALLAGLANSTVTTAASPLTT